MKLVLLSSGIGLKHFYNLGACTNLINDSDSKFSQLTQNQTITLIMILNIPNASIIHTRHIHYNSSSLSSKYNQSKTGKTSILLNSHTSDKEFPLPSQNCSQTQNMETPPNL